MAGSRFFTKHQRWVGQDLRSKGQTFHFATRNAFDSTLYSNQRPFALFEAKLFDDLIDSLHAFCCRNVSIHSHGGLEKKGLWSQSQFLVVIVAEMSTTTESGSGPAPSGVSNDTTTSRGRSRRSFRQRKDQWQSQDTNLPGCKPRLGTVGRQLSEAT